MLTTWKFEGQSTTNPGRDGLVQYLQASKDGKKIIFLKKAAQYQHMIMALNILKLFAHEWLNNAVTILNQSLFGNDFFV